MDDRQYYVYVYFDPDTDVPFYVGKGHGYRSKKHLHQTHSRPMRMKIQALKAANRLPKIQEFYTPSEQAAFDLEILLIASYGKRSDGSGSLFNEADGGAATTGFSGRKHSEESRRKISESGRGKVRSDETRDKLRMAGLARDVSHLHSDDSRAARKRTTETPEFRAILSENARKTVTPERLVAMTEKARLVNTGRKVSAETRRRMSEASKRRVISDEARANMSAGQRRRYARTDD